MKLILLNRRLNMNNYSYPMTLNEESQKAKDIIVNCSISREKLKNGSDEFDAKRVLLKNDISFEEQLKVICNVLCKIYLEKGGNQCGSATNENSNCIC